MSLEADRLNEIARLRTRVSELEEAGRTICEAFDAGVFIRSTKGDDDPAWAIKLMKPLRAIAVFAAIEADKG